MKRIVFLYTELAGYTMACLRAIPPDQASVHVVRYPVNREAPFEFSGPEHVVLLDRRAMSDDQLMQWLDTVSPDLLLVSGWIDKGYLKAASAWVNRIPVVLLLDNPWTGSLRQRIGAGVARLTLRRKFSHAWVPGPAQERFALQLGFHPGCISTGFYCADRTLFLGYYQQFHEGKSIRYPKRLLYVGRYLEFKGILDLWEAFTSLSDEFPEWELVCAGAGDLWEQREMHDKIIHRGFVQPGDMGELIRETSWFVLPSHREPWGVVVQEMAAAGMPMVLSDKVSATAAFLQEGENGYVFSAGDADDLRRVLRMAMSAEQPVFNRMQDASNRSSGWTTPEKWVATLLSLVRS